MGLKSNHSVGGVGRAHMLQSLLAGMAHMAGLIEGGMSHRDAVAQAVVSLVSLAFLLRVRRVLYDSFVPPQYSMIRIVNDVAKMAVTCCDMLFAALSASSAPGTYLHAPRYLYGTCSCSFLGPVSTPVLRNGSIRQSR